MRKIEMALGLALVKCCSCLRREEASQHHVELLVHKLSIAGLEKRLVAENPEQALDNRGPAMIDRSATSGVDR